jgi:hypothetical protein
MPLAKAHAGRFDPFARVGLPDLPGRSGPSDIIANTASIRPRAQRLAVRLRAFIP